MLRVASLIALCSASIFAQDGGQLYTLYCSSCHGADGKGATGGMFPPLAGSPWVLADAALPVKIVLHGLHGPVEVDGRTYNLEMPPQGGVLPDDQIAAILSHVRTSWGNQAGRVTPDSVKSIRESCADRTAPWTADELLKVHPLPASAPPIANLLSRVYKGEWQTLPDFSTLQAENIEEEHHGRISLARAGHHDLFGMVWEGDLTIPESGEFRFRLDADDGARVVIDDREVVRVDGTGPMDGSRAKEGRIELKAGVSKLRVEYFEFRGQEGIALSWTGPGIPHWKTLTDRPPRTGPDPIPVIPRDGRAVVYRNFIAGTTPRAIGIGFPGGVNLAYSADHLATELIWTGAFMDGARHWTERGQGDQPPAGENVVKLSGSIAFPKGARFRGYKLDPAGNPTFSVQIGNQTVLDFWKPGSGSPSPSFVREIQLRDGSQPMEMLLTDRLPAEPAGDKVYHLGTELVLEVENAAIVTSGGKSFLRISPGRAAVLTYRWK